MLKRIAKQNTVVFIKVLLIIGKTAMHKKSSVRDKGEVLEAEIVDIKTLVLIRIEVRVCIGILTKIEQQQQMILKSKGSRNHV